MHPLRKQRMQWICLMLISVSIATALIGYILRQNANFFYTPSQIANGQAPIGVSLRAGGEVVVGSLKRARESLLIEFHVSDDWHSVKVTYEGILPDLFSEGQSTVVTGKIDDQNILHAVQVLAKHDENYTPPEIAGMYEDRGT
ncbi:MAG: cytochrome c biogenesis protein CcmE [Cellvibrionales bacterium TMED49]|nr:cytochrome c biogenesis protein CcmE [Porticoccaceae bacterium]OUU39640.1 MAG: cytochrome c biogenesis protein CcmE [Cellvibrionales bacterium TMED49]